MLENKNKVEVLIPLVSIVLSNALVVYGVLFLNWNFFTVIYSYWFGELVSSVFDKIKYRTLKKRNELPAVNLEADSSGRFFFLFVYWVFIVIIAGFIAAPENTYGENLLVIFFMNKVFNMNLLVLIVGEMVMYYKQFILSKEYRPEQIVKANGMMNKKTMIMHISIIFGAFVWFAMHVDNFFIHINPGKYGDDAFMMVFVGIRVTGDLMSLFSNTAKSSQ